MSWRDTPPEMRWSEEEYLQNPFAMNYDEWLSLDNAPVPEEDEPYYGGEEVWVLQAQEMDLLVWGKATGLYKWDGAGFEVEVDIDGVLGWFEDKNVWKCVKE